MPELSLDSIGLTEVDTLAAKIVTYVHHFMPRDLVNVTILDRGELVVRATIGNRTGRMAGMRFPVQTGLGGLAVLKRRMISVRDYARLEWPLPFLDVMVRDEGIRAAAGVPFFVKSEPVGLLFLGRRGGPIPAADLRKLRETSEAAGPLLGASMQLARSVEAAQTEERHRLAAQLHEEIIPLLFAIGAAARRMREILPPEAAEALGHTGSIEGMASSANALARGALASLDTLRSDQDLILRIRAASGRFTGLTEKPVSFGTVGTPLPLDQAATETLASAVAEALNNIAKHAPAAAVVVTLTYGPEAVRVAILDDGSGRPTDVTLPSISEATAGQHYGLASLAHRLAVLSGELTVESNEDGGVTVQASVPVLPR